MNYSVYKHTFPNGKVYIGITSMKPERRWRSGDGYTRKNKSGNLGQPLMANAVVKYGWDNIKHDILYDGLTREEAENKEIELINLYKSNNSQFGYNIDKGGNACKHSEKTKRKISRAFKGVSKEKHKKPIVCVETGIIYPSLKEAEEKTNIPYYNISAVLHKKQKTAGGCHWEYVNEIDKEKQKKYKNKIKTHKIDLKKAVRCIETNDIYESITCASKETGIPRSNISRVCSKKIKTAGGYHWEIVDKNIETEI